MGITKNGEKLGILMDSELKLILIKPLSVNKCWQGTRYKTKIYKDYINNLMPLLPDMNNRFKNEPTILFIKFGFSNHLSDIDNPVKPFLDILQKRYNFNDRWIHKLFISKERVAKNEDFIKFNVCSISDKKRKEKMIKDIL